MATSEAKGHKLIAEIERAAHLVRRRFFWSEATVIMADIKENRTIDREIGGIRMRFFEEQLAPGAFNLMIEARRDKFQCQAGNSCYKLTQALEEMAPRPMAETNASSQQE